MSQSQVEYTGKMKQKATLFKYSSKNKKFTATKQTIKKGSDVSIDKSDSNGYYRIDKDSDSKNGLWVPQKTVKVNNEAALESKLKKAAKKDTKMIKNSLNKNDRKFSSVNVNKLLVTNLTGIMGAPYQFMTTCDNPVAEGTVFGRKYIERIVERMPLLLITPGEPDFMPSFSKKQRDSVLKILTDVSKDDKSEYSAFLKGKTSRYYTFKFKEKEYWKYVNAMLRYCAISLGINKVRHKINQTNYHGKSVAINQTGSAPKKYVYNKKLQNYQWQKAVNPNFKKYVQGSASAIAFYLDSETSISESMSTGTTTSQLAGAINGAADTAREFRFLAGPIAGIQAEAKDKGMFTKAYNTIMSTGRKFLGPGSNKLFDNLDEMFKAIGKGGKLVFPEIWEDSDFSRSYDVSMKLRTPDGDKISWYLNICVPLIHILALAAPRSLNPNSYKSPFLVRAYYKGIFSVDMGIITGVSITKGRDAAWTLDGLPTEVDVQMSIKDLYNMLAISHVGTNSAKDFITGSGVKKFLKNTCLIDYLSNMCGININKPDIVRNINTYILFRKNQYSDIYGNLWLGINDSVSNRVGRIYDKAFKYQ